MDSNADLEYSEDALCARLDFLLRDCHINIIVEDRSKEYLYETIFQRLFSENLTIDIHGVGGKPKVKKIYEEFGCEDSDIQNRKFFYILDGDFDHFLYPENIINSKCCEYLKSYNIENYLIDESSCTCYIKGRIERKDSECKELIAFEEWKQSITLQASKLFFLYCYIQKNFPTEENISRAHCRFIDENTGLEKNDSSFDIYKNEYLRRDPEIEDKILHIKSLYHDVYGENYFHLICGKFLITSLMYYLKVKFKPYSKCNMIIKEDFFWCLANNFDICKFSGLKQKILDCIES